jgi:hypothetical protein
MWKLDALELDDGWEGCPAAMMLMRACVAFIVSCMAWLLTSGGVVLIAGVALSAGARMGPTSCGESRRGITGLVGRQPGGAVVTCVEERLLVEGPGTAGGSLPEAGISLDQR